MTSDENGNMCPDAAISKIHQRDFGPSLGFGEVKIVRPTPDKHSLCHDLLRLATLVKDTTDNNKVQAALAFQSMGSTVFLSCHACDELECVACKRMANSRFPAPLKSWLPLST